MEIVTDSNIMKKGHMKLEKGWEVTGKDVEGKGISGLHGNQNTQACDLQTGRVLPADFRKDRTARS